METWPQFLLRKIQEREKELGRRVSNKEFGDLLGVSAVTISQWINGKYKPGTEIINRLAEILGAEVYFVLGYGSPEPDLRYISRNWENLPDEARHQIKEIVDKYVYRKP